MRMVVESHNILRCSKCSFFDMRRNCAGRGSIDAIDHTPEEKGARPSHCAGSRTKPARPTHLVLRLVFSIDIVTRPQMHLRNREP